MSPAVINLILGVIAALPQICGEAAELLTVLRGEQLTPEQIQRLEKLELQARSDWDQVVNEDQPET
jgi:hypothetical protein